MGSSRNLRSPVSSSSTSSSPPPSASSSSSRSSSLSPCPSFSLPGVHRALLLACTLCCGLVAPSGALTVCQQSFQAKSQVYNFNLAAPLPDHPHGALSEDGHFKIVQAVEGTSGEAIFWFQLCEHMKFNSDPPRCQECPETCGGPEHCGETCTALRALSFQGYTQCSTLSVPSNTSYSLIDAAAPSRGIAVHMAGGDSAKCQPGVSSSLTVHVECSHLETALPTGVVEDPHGSCHFVASMRHPSGCPMVTHAKGGIGWFGFLLLFILCGAVVYLTVGIAYRTTVLGVSGIEAIPNLALWQDIPRLLSVGWEHLQESLGALYRRCFENRYFRAEEV